MRDVIGIVQVQHKQGRSRVKPRAITDGVRGIMPDGGAAAYSLVGFPFGSDGSSLEESVTKRESHK